MKKRQNSLILKFSLKKIIVRKFNRYIKLTYRQNKNNINSYLRIYKVNIKRGARLAIRRFREASRRPKINL